MANVARSAPSAPQGTPDNIINEITESNLVSALFLLEHSDDFHTLLMSNLLSWAGAKLETVATQAQLTAISTNLRLTPLAKVTTAFGAYAVNDILIYDHAASSWKVLVAATTGGGTDYTVGTTLPTNPSNNALHQLNADAAISAVSHRQNFTARTFGADYNGASANYMLWGSRSGNNGFYFKFSTSQNANINADWLTSLKSGDSIDFGSALTLNLTGSPVIVSDIYGTHVYISDSNYSNTISTQPFTNGTVYNVRAKPANFDDGDVLRYNSGLSLWERVYSLSAGVTPRGAGDGLVLDGNDLDVNPGDGLEIESDKVKVKAGDSSVTVDSDGVKVANPFAEADETKLDGIEADAEVNPRHEVKFAAISADTDDGIGDGEIGFYNGNTQVQSGWHESGDAD